MRFVEQPQFRAARHEAGQRGSATLTGGESTDAHVTESTVEPESRHRRLSIDLIGTCGPRPETDVVGHGEVVVEPTPVGQQPDSPTDRTSIRSQVGTEDPCIAGGDRNEPGERPKQCRLPRTVGAAQEHDAPAVDIEIDTGEGGESAEEGHRPSEVDHRLRPGPGSGVVGLHGVTRG